MILVLVMNHKTCCALEKISPFKLHTMQSIVCKHRKNLNRISNCQNSNCQLTRKLNAVNSIPNITDRFSSLSKVLVKRRDRRALIACERYKLRLNREQCVVKTTVETKNLHACIS